jgi:Secretion system C-terminal sorting domain
MRIKHFTLLIILFIAHLSFGQVEKVKYYLRYDESKCWYDICLVILEGSATSTINRAQFNSQITIVVPTGSQFTIEKLNLPLQANQNQTGTKPLVWYVNNFVASPESQPESDFFGITPTLNPTSFYNNLKAKDTIVLFSASIKDVTTCGQGVRFFENGIDPGSAAPGMNGGDFSNGFTMGSTEQIYFDNVPTKRPTKPIVKELVSSCVGGINISFNTQAQSCHGLNSYLWKGPNGFTSTTKNVSIPNATSANDGQYTLFISDAMNCRDTIKVNAVSAPNAGQDQYVKCFNNGKTVLNSSATGQWDFLPNQSVGTVSINGALSESVIELSQFSTKGTYTFTRKNANCADTVKIFVDDICDCSLGNFITQPQIIEYCGSAIDILINGVELPSNRYKWLYQFNNGNLKLAPGENIKKNFYTEQLGVGQHLFRRVYYNEDNTCADTSSAVVLIVKEAISASGDITKPCYKEAIVDITSEGNGYWQVGALSAGSLKIKDFYANNTQLSQFSSAGIYYLIWTNDICSDTVVINAKPLCGCVEAKVDEIRNVCSGDNVVLKGSCPDGRWDILGGILPGVTIDSVNNGNAHITIDWKKAPKTFKAKFTVDFESILLSDTTTLYLRPNPTLNVGHDFDFCRESSEVIISASGGHSGFIWSNGSTNRYILVSPSVKTNYSVEAQNVYGCKGRDTMTVFVREKPKGQIPAVIRSKVGEKLVLNAGFWTEAMEYIWTGPNNFESRNKIVTFNAAKTEHVGVYTLTVISSYDCYAYATVNVEVANTFNSPNIAKIQIQKSTITNRGSDALELYGDQIRIYPNPASEMVSIKHDNITQGQVQILDFMGKVIMTKHISSKLTEMEVSNLASGTYFVKVLSEGLRLTDRLVIIR